MIAKIITHLTFGCTLVRTTSGLFYMSNPERTMIIRCTEAGATMFDNGLIENGPPINQYSRLMNLTQAGEDYFRTAPSVGKGAEQ